MTLEFAKREAQRRTDVLGTTHYVVESRLYRDQYIILTEISTGYEPVFTSYPTE